VDRDRSVGVAVRCRLDGPVIESQWRRGFSPLVQNLTVAHSGLLHLQWVTGLFTWGWSDRGVALTTLPTFYPRGQRKSRVIPLLPVWASLACFEMEFSLLMWYFLTVSMNHVTFCHLSWIAWMWPIFFVCCCGQPAHSHAPTLYSSLCTLFSVA